jgi:hypothetical protein
MSKEFLKMQKLAGLITENQYTETLTEVESDLVALLYSLRNSINDGDKEQSMGMINQLLSIARDMEDAQLTEIEGDPDDYYGYNEPIDPNDYADGNPSDAIIYDALLDMDHEQLVSDMLSTAENNPSITLVKYLDKYDSSND